MKINQTANLSSGHAFDATDAFSSVFSSFPVGVIGYTSDHTNMSDEAIRDVCEKLKEVMDHGTVQLPHGLAATPVNNPQAKLPVPKSIYRSGKVTTVLWDDDTITTVSLREDNDDSPYTAFAYAVTKKLFGSMKQITRLVDTIHADKIRERKQAEKEARRKEQEERHLANLAKKAAKAAKNAVAAPTEEDPGEYICPTCRL